MNALFKPDANACVASRSKNQGELIKQPEFELVSHLLCPYVQRSVIVLREKSIAYSRTDIDLACKPAWFERISPMGRVPVLRVNGARSLFESAVICEYLNEITPGSLHPQDALEKAHHRAWIEFGSGLLDSIGGLYNAKNAASFAGKREEIRNKLRHVEAQLCGAPFFTGAEFHLIDAVYGPVFRYFDVFDRVVDLGIFEDLPKINTWRRALKNRESVQRAVTSKYPALLLEFLAKRNSYMAGIVGAAVA